MSEEDRIELKKELSVYSKEELLEKYIDELEENNILTNQWYKSSQRINRAIEHIEKSWNEKCTIPLEEVGYSTDNRWEIWKILKGSDK